MARRTYDWLSFAFFVGNPNIFKTCANSETSRLIEEYLKSDRSSPQRTALVETPKGDKIDLDRNIYGRFEDQQL